jgi:uncharacterized membrane protein
MMSTDTLIAILAMAVATYATRIGGILLGGYLPRRPAASDERWMPCRRRC